MDIVQKVVFLLFITSLFVSAISTHTVSAENKWFELLVLKQFVVVVLLAAFIFIVIGVMRG